MSNKKWYRGKMNLFKWVFVPALLTVWVVSCKKREIEKLEPQQNNVLLAKLRAWSDNNPLRFTLPVPENGKTVPLIKDFTPVWDESVVTSNSDGTLTVITRITRVQQVEYSYEQGFVRRLRLITSEDGETVLQAHIIEVVGEFELIKASHNDFIAQAFNEQIPNFTGTLLVYNTDYELQQARIFQAGQVINTDAGTYYEVWEEEQSSNEKLGETACGWIQYSAFVQVDCGTGNPLKMVNKGAECWNTVYFSAYLPCPKSVDADGGTPGDTGGGGPGTPTSPTPTNPTPTNPTPTSPTKPPLDPDELDLGDNLPVRKPLELTPEDRIMLAQLNAIRDTVFPLAEGDKLNQKQLLKLAYTYDKILNSHPFYQRIHDRYVASGRKLIMHKSPASQSVTYEAAFQYDNANLGRIIINRNRMDNVKNAAVIAEEYVHSYQGLFEPTQGGNSATEKKLMREFEAKLIIEILYWDMRENHGVRTFRAKVLFEHLGNTSYSGQQPNFNMEKAWTDWIKGIVDDGNLPTSFNENMTQADFAQFIQWFRQYGPPEYNLTSYPYNPAQTPAALFHLFTP